MVIETDRLILREWRLSDLDDLIEGLNDFDVAKNLTVPFPYTFEEGTNFIKNHCKNKNNSYYFAVQLKNENKVIGGTNIKVIENRAKGGIWINKKYHNQGFGTEVFKARAEFSFNKLNLDEIESGYFEFNEKSWKMQRKIGFKAVGKIKNFSRALNNEVDEVVTKLTKSDFFN